MDRTVSLHAWVISSGVYGTSIMRMRAELKSRVTWSVRRKMAGPWAVS